MIGVEPIIYKISNTPTLSKGTSASITEDGAYTDKSSFSIPRPSAHYGISVILRLSISLSKYNYCEIACFKYWPIYNGISLVPSPPLPLTKWPQKRWSGIFGPTPWLASTYLEYFWPIKSPLDHVLTKSRVSLVREDMEDDSQTFFYGSWICHRTGSQS